MATPLEPNISRNTGQDIVTYTKCPCCTLHQRDMRNTGSSGSSIITVKEIKAINRFSMLNTPGLC